MPPPDGGVIATWTSATAMVAGGAAATVLGALLVARGQARAISERRGQIQQYGSAAKNLPQGPSRPGSGKRPVVQIQRTPRAQALAEEQRQKREQVIRDVRSNASEDAALQEQEAASLSERK